MNCRVVPFAMLGLVGVTAMDTSVAGVTVRMVDPDVLPDVAVIVVFPTALPVQCPLLWTVIASVAVNMENPLEAAGSSMIATVVSDELQTRESVRS
jgi:hypothetical protein